MLNKIEKKTWRIPFIDTFGVCITIAEFPCRTVGWMLNLHSSMKFREDPENFCHLQLLRQLMDKKIRAFWQSWELIFGFQLVRQTLTIIWRMWRLHHFILEVWPEFAPPCKMAKLTSSIVFWSTEIFSLGKRFKLLFLFGNFNIPITFHSITGKFFQINH